MEILTTDELNGLGVEDLEALSYELTKARQDIRAYAMNVQDALGRKNEAARISKLLGRDVQILEATGIKSAEALGEPGAG